MLPYGRRGGFYIRPCNLGQRKTAGASTARPYTRPALRYYANKTPYKTTVPIVNRINIDFIKVYRIG